MTAHLPYIFIPEGYAIEWQPASIGPVADGAQYARELELADLPLIVINRTGGRLTQDEIDALDAHIKAYT